jgi:ribose transport system substrate-binding protein
MKKTFRFIIVPKVAHPWFDEVNKGAQAQAETLRRELGIDIAVDYVPPLTCDVVEQNRILDKLAASPPSGIAVDPVDTVNHMTGINRMRERGIPVVLFDSPSPDPGITGIGNDFARQGIIAAERLVKRIGHAGKVAVMQGYPTAPNHKARFDAQVAVLKKYPGITIVDGGIDNDDIETAQERALAVLEAHSDLKGYLCCDASRSGRDSQCCQEGGKNRQGDGCQYGWDQAYLSGHSGRRDRIFLGDHPEMQGSMCVLMLLQASLDCRRHNR